MNKLLLIIDPQVDFINGSLPVPDAAVAMDKLADYVTTHGDEYVYKVITNDWHPANHCSFSVNNGQWPIHCQQHTQGAEIWPHLLKALKSNPDKFEVLRKGDIHSAEEYSIFKNQLSTMRLKEIIKTNNIDKIDVCGIAGDICVLDTLKDGIELFGRDMFNVLKEYSPSLDNGVALNEFINKELK
ncbi:MAG: isochorismatase family protein [Marinifilaceae bacterium]